MPTLAHQHRIRAAAIGKKGGIEAAMLMESELVVTTKMMQRRVDDISASPTNIASTFDLNEMPMMKLLPEALEEIKPLPGAWMVVGKGGRPLKDGVMYDAPSPKKKKKKRNRARKVPGSDCEEWSELADFAEAPSTSTCEQMLHCSTMRRQKEVGKQQERKLWSAYRQEKTIKILARDSLIYTLAKGGMLCEEAEEPALEMSEPEPLPRRHDKGSSLRSKLRRRARFASAAARCYSTEGSEYTETSFDADSRKPSAEIEQSAPSSERWSLDKDMECDDKVPQHTSWAVPASWSWTTVPKSRGKRGSKNCSVA